MASRTTGTMARRCSREASSGTTPPYFPCVSSCDATTEASSVAAVLHHRGGGLVAGRFDPEYAHLFLLYRRVRGGRTGIPAGGETAENGGDYVSRYDGKLMNAEMTVGNLNTETAMFRAARWLTLASAVCALFSIAACQILLAMALAALLLSGARLRLPPVWLPIAAVHRGLADLAGAFRRPRRRPFADSQILRLAYAAGGLLHLARPRMDKAAVPGLGRRGGHQPRCGRWCSSTTRWRRPRLLGRGFYDYYVAERITGFMSHWMTFSGQMMYVIILLAAYLLFAPGARKRLFLWMACLALVGAALLLGFTRSISFVATPAALLYLIWFWKRKALLAVPVLAVVAFLAAPQSVKTRFTSIFQPGQVDSNEFRKVAWLGGLRIIEQHPWFGLGPERVKARFDGVHPPDVPRPLPMGWYGHLHSIYLHYAAERGIPTMLALLWFLGHALWDLFPRGAPAAARPRRPASSSCMPALAAVIATLVEGFFELNLGDSEVLTMFLAIVACGYAAAECARVARREAASAAL